MRLRPEVRCHKPNRLGSELHLPRLQVEEAALSLRKFFRANMKDASTAPSLPDSRFPPGGAGRPRLLVVTPACDRGTIQRLSGSLKRPRRSRGLKPRLNRSCEMFLKRLVARWFGIQRA